MQTQAVTSVVVSPEPVPVGLRLQVPSQSSAFYYFKAPDNLLKANAGLKKAGKVVVGGEVAAADICVSLEVEAAAALLIL